MNRRTFILSVGCEAALAIGQGFASELACFGAAHVHSGTDLVGTTVAAMTAGHGRLFAQESSVLAGMRRYGVDRISCIFQPDSAIFLRDNKPILAYRTTFCEKDGQDKTNNQTSRSPQVPFPCFTRLSSPSSLLPLSPLRKSAAAAFVCDNVNGVNYTVKNSKKNAVPCGQIRSNGLKWKGMSEIGSDGVMTKKNSWNLGIQSVFDDECKWVNPDGRVQMADIRRFRVAFYDNSRYGIDATIDWYAIDDVMITANQNCLFGVQTSAPLTQIGGGSMMNSNGAYGAKAIYGRRANWVTCWGRLQRSNPEAVPQDNPDLLEGVALMSHPSNPWGVSPWNVNRFGYMSPTHIPFLSKPWQVRAGEGVRLRYLILAYTGNPDDGEVDEIYRSYIST